MSFDGRGCDRRTFLQVAGLTTVSGSMLGFASDLATAQASTLGATQAGDLAWPRRGNFGYKTLVGPHQPDPRAMLDEDTSYFGLYVEGSFLYGCFRDDAGEMYEICRRIPGKSGMAGGWTEMFLMTTPGHDVLRMDPSTIQTSGHADNCVRELKDGVGVWSKAPGAKGLPFKVTMSTDRCTWFEEGVIDVAGDLLGPGLQWYIPAAQLGDFYVSQLFQMQGTIRGKKVRGIIGFDQIYLPKGALQYRHLDVLTDDKLHRCWYTWGTRYTDGSFEGGHFMLGHDRSGFALLTNDKQELTLDTDVTGVITPGRDGNFPQTIRVTVGKQEWEFLPDPKGQMPDLLNAKQPATPQNEGRWRRVGDTREPDVWFAWGEIAPSHGLSHQRRLRY